MAPEKATFKVGDTVVLKSGGPQMTVWRDVDDYTNYVDCVWFNGGEKKYDRFHIATLTKVDATNATVS